MPIATKDLYRSANGDRWLLVRDDAGRVFVRHEANNASGRAVPRRGFLIDQVEELSLVVGGVETTASLFAPT